MFFQSFYLEKLIKYNYLLHKNKYVYYYINFLSNFFILLMRLIYHCKILIFIQSIDIYCY